MTISSADVEQWLMQLEFEEEYYRRQHSNGLFIDLSIRGVYFNFRHFTTNVTEDFTNVH